MFRRWLCLAILAALAIPVTSRAQSPSAADKEQVLALSRWIDNYLEKRWKELGVSPAGLAEDSIYFRRLSLDLMGKIPELTQLRDFLDDRRSEKRWEWVERYLSDGGSSRHFANVWRTTIIGRSNNPQFAGLYPQFEGFLRERFEKNTPIDEVVRQILTQQNAGAMVRPGVVAARGVGANAFFVVNENKPENLAGNTSRAFLGVKIECAQCHAHPFAKWKKEQFWEFAAFYSGLNVGNPRVIGGRVQKAPPAGAGRQIKIPETDTVVKAKFLGGEEPKWEADSDSRKVLADWVTSPENPYFARAMADHVWAYFFGVSLLEPILEPSDDSPVTHEDLLDELARQLVAQKFDLKFLMRAIVHTQAYQRSSGGPAAASKDDYHLFLRMPVRSLTPEQLFDSLAEATAFRQASTGMDPRVGFNPNQRTPRNEFLAKFGTQERRYDPQTSILQALFMMNGQFMTDRTRAETNRDLKAVLDSPVSLPRRVETMYFMVLSRPPRPEETARLVEYLQSGGPSGDPRRALEDVYWALLNSPEFLFNH